MLIEARKHRPTIRQFSVSRVRNLYSDDACLRVIGHVRAPAYWFLYNNLIFVEEDFFFPFRTELALFVFANKMCGNIIRVDELLHILWQANPSSQTTSAFYKALNPLSKPKMGMLINTLILSLVLVLVIPICSGQNISRGSFPKGFVFGTASSAYQYEGAVKEDGRSQTIWDTFAHSFGKVFDGSNADIANDQYHLYPGDIKLMKDMGVDAYRFSIAWSRVYPNGTGTINQAGVDHYNNLINALLASGIKPYVTIYHWDLPQSLQDRYTGWLSSQSIKDFAMYAETCFLKFGDRVKNWITVNEPHTFAIQGYDSGIEAPSRCSFSICKAGNSSEEPYIVGHNMLLAHAAAASIYKRKYKLLQRGSIGISLDTYWYEPATNTTADIQATKRALDFSLGWFIDPLVHGDYPEIMRSRVGSRLPKFSRIQSILLKGSFDFIGINHYTTWYASESTFNYSVKDALADSGSSSSPIALGKPIPDRANSIWLFIVPHGIRSLMNYIKQKYGNPPVIITENGMDDENSRLIPLKNALKDGKRIKYHSDYIANLLAAIRSDGCNVRGYFIWSLLDNWEWTVGFSSRFGLYYVDYNDKLKRYPKDSVKWFKNFLGS